MVSDVGSVIVVVVVLKTLNCNPLFNSDTLFTDRKEAH